MGSSSCHGQTKPGSKHDRTWGRRGRRKREGEERGGERKKKNGDIKKDRDAHSSQRDAQRQVETHTDTHRDKQTRRKIQNTPYTPTRGNSLISTSTLSLCTDIPLTFPSPPPSYCLAHSLSLLPLSYSLSPFSQSLSLSLSAMLSPPLGLAAKTYE